MAFLRLLVLAALVFLGSGPALAHHMGRTVPFVHTGDVEAAMAANVVAAYFGEQMGRTTLLESRESAHRCLQALSDKAAPMAVVSGVPAPAAPESVRRVEPALEVAGVTVTLWIHREAADRLEFSLVPRYMEKLAGISHESWAEVVRQARNGAGMKKLALDLLREADLL